MNPGHVQRCYEEGVLAKILSPADSAPVKVGLLIATILEDKDWKDVAIPISGSSAAALAVCTPVPSAPKSVSIPSG